MDTDLRPNSMDVDVAAIAHNVRRLRDACGAVTMVAALKANAYGFGLLPVAETVLAAGADALAVVRIDHAVELRGAGITVPIILYAGVPPDQDAIAAIERHDLTVTIVDHETRRAYASAGHRIRALVKVDVGLERLGAAPADAADLARAVAGEPSLDLAGVYTHLHVPAGALEPVDRYVRWQFERFAAVLDDLDRAGVPVTLRMAVSS